MPKGLWVVATPLGNLSDLSDRARQALGEADAILCEDTRRTRALLQALGLTNRTVRFDAHVEGRHGDHETTAQIVEELSHGKSLALVTDAGTPAIADPGARLVAAAHDAGIRVTPIPGPSAVATLVSVAGFPSASFQFHGFFPRTATERAHVLSRLVPDCVHVWFESPQRICECVDALAATLPYPVLAAKELTKIHEKLFRGPAPVVRDTVTTHVEREGPVGEWAVALSIPAEPSASQDADDAQAAWRLALECLLDHGIAVSDAAKSISQKFGVRKNVVYDAALKKSQKK